MNQVAATAETMNPILRALNEGGFVMYVIMVLAVLVLILIIERFMTLKSLRVDKKEFSDQVFKMIIGGDLRQAISYCDSKPTPLSNTVKSGLVQVLNKRPDEEVQVAMDAAVLREMPKLEGDNHYNQFVDAVMGKGKTSAPFSYAGPLTESVLLGPIATRFPNTTLEWNAAKLMFKNSPEATQFVHRPSRAGWKVKGL